ncbi:anhydro-N-acetylmuramic acid kinase [Henriciella aquimarina]|uniref:anhydro-N-acetylmuramic acid kinase n=1 Tax=Henriciella aquimarina TaxID=545261 RepID=UPI001F18CB76|nr:anhydro-N-acetylmuramic acid kinase [Henriciella aquimarina]
MNLQSEDFEPVWSAGFMSGTSIDAVDAALILTDGVEVLDFGPVAERKYTPGERNTLKQAIGEARAWNWAGPPPEQAFDAARAVLTATHADAWARLLENWDGPRPALAGIHGQTVLHRAPGKARPGATLQVLDPGAMRAELGVPVAFDFRSNDVAHGGHGAPLAPAYHAALLRQLGAGQSAAVLNLGGVANITYRKRDGSLYAFDTGPANGPIDEWVEGHDAGTHDEGGRLAASGRVHEGALTQWMAHPWFDEPAPKSLDRFDFNASLARGLSLEDGAATLTAFSAEAVAHAIRGFDDTPSQIILCGGGRHNPQLVRELKQRCQCTIRTAEEVGWMGDSIEAQAFAFLAVRTLRRLPISWPGTTSVPEPMTGGELLP